MVGDVSGKGLKAAMTVSAIVGALRDSNERQPSQVLAQSQSRVSRRNRRFRHLLRDTHRGRWAVTAANAGHLSPYRWRKKLAVPDGLPFGILAETSYVETQLELGPGDRLTFVSDGVVEAQFEARTLWIRPHGGTHHKRAAEIAETAQQCGQEDDITVLTVARAPKLETSIC